MTPAIASFANGVAAGVLNAFWEDAVLVLAVWLLLRAWPRLNAATRYLVWGTTLVAAIIVPVATTVPFLTAPPPSVHTRAGDAPKAGTQVRVSAPSRVDSGMPSPNRRTGGGVSRETLPRVSAMRFPERFRLTLPMPVAVGVCALWLVLASLGLVRLLLGIRKLEALKRDALPLPVAYRDAMSRWMGAQKGGREVRLCVSEAIDVPVAIGLFDAMILIPSVLLHDLDQSEVDQISLHELAHLRRADDWSNGIARALLALLAWNPAAQFVTAQLDLEREVACDDWVLAQVGAARPYAITLTKMAENAAWPRSPVAAPGVFATRKQISLRIERLLAAGRNAATSLTLAPALAAVAVVAALGIGMAMVAPSLAAASLPAPAVANVAVTTIPKAAAARATLAKAAIAQAAVAKAAVERNLVATSRRDVVAQVLPVPSPPAHAPATRPKRPIRTIVIPGEHIHIPGRTVTIPPVNVDVPKQRLALPSAGFMQETVRASVRAALGSVNAAMHAFGGAGSWSGHDAMAKAKPTLHCDTCDFSGASWPGRDLHGARYAVVDLSHANLRGVDLSAGRFAMVDFSRADLRGANLSGSVFTYADFSDARLAGANFAGATLRACDLSGADLRNVDLSKTKLIDTSIPSAPPTPPPPPTPTP